MEEVETVRVFGGCLAPSLTEPKTWYFFDDRGIEVKVHMIGKVTYYSHHLRPEIKNSISKVIRPI